MSKYHQEIRAARTAQKELARRGSAERNALVEAVASALEVQQAAILSANQKDISANPDLSSALIDRLRLTESRIQAMADSMRAIGALPSPLDSPAESWVTESGLAIHRVAVPLGVIAIIYEARPNVTIDAAALSLMSANAVVLRGSASAKQSNAMLVSILHDVLDDFQLPKELVVLLPAESRAEVDELLAMRGDIDVVIPRGGKDLIAHVVSQAKVPVIETGAGVCHLYIDASARPDMANTIALNAKTQRPSVCNAVETILIHENWGDDYIVDLVQALQHAGVEVRGCPRIAALVSSVTPATEEDWSTEYLSLCVSIRVLSSISEACTHIETYGTNHSESIITENREAVDFFFAQVDSAAVYHNASTRFTDGGEFGFGAEMGISTQKLHVRGPVGLRHLVSYQYRIYGKGTIRT